MDFRFGLYIKVLTIGFLETIFIISFISLQILKYGLHTKYELSIKI